MQVRRRTVTNNGPVKLMCLQPEMRQAIQFQDAVLTGGHWQMNPSGILLATAQVPPF